MFFKNVNKFYIYRTNARSGLKALNKIDALGLDHRRQGQLILSIAHNTHSYRKLAP